MRVYLMRHGPAVDRNDPDCPPDPDRPLTAQGVHRTRLAALGLVHLGIAPTVVLVSPYVRARETAELVLVAFNLNRRALVVTDALLPDARPQRVPALVRGRRSPEVLCVGHLPHLDLAIAHLVGVQEAITFLKKAGVACVDLPPRGSGTLVWLLTGKQLAEVRR